MASGSAFGNAPVFQSQLPPIRDVQDRRWIGAGSRNFRHLRGQSGVQLEGAGKRVPSGAQALLVNRLRTWALLVACFVVASPIAAQKRVRLDVLPPPENAWTDGPPFVSSAGLLADASMRDLLSNGFPARLHYRLERWASGRWFDDLKATVEWDVILKYDVLGKRYQAVRVVNKKVEALGDFGTVDDAEGAAEGPYRPGISLPKKGQRGY